MSIQKKAYIRSVELRKEGYNRSESIRLLLMKFDTLCTTGIDCKYCGESKSIVHFGFAKNGNQRYLCHKCGHTFMNNNAIGRKQYPTEMIYTAVELFCSGMSLFRIEQQLQLDYGFSPERMTIWRWVKYFKDEK